MTKFKAMAIAKRKGVNPKEGEHKYGDVSYADPVNKKYPIDTEEHIRAAWNYIHHSDNAGKYSSGDAAKIKARIASAWRSKIDSKGPPSAASACYVVPRLASCDNTALTVSAEGKAPSSIMFMPEGRHTISAAVNGEAKTLDVEVTAATADLLQADLNNLLRQNVTPFLDFNHENKESAGTPKQFRFEPGRGVMLDVEWSGDGQRKVEDKTFRYFSPQFLILDGTPSGLPKAGAIGALTNDPAFRSIERIAASRQEPISVDYTIENQTTKKEPKEMALVAALRRVGLVPDSIEEDNEDQVVEAIQNLVVGLQSENQVLKTEAANVRAAAIGAEADSFIAQAVSAGRIEPQNQTLKDSIKALFLRDKVSAKAWVESLKPNPALGSPIVSISAENRETDSKTLSNKAEQCKALVIKAQRANPNFSFQDAWNFCAAENPSLFGR